MKNGLSSKEKQVLLELAKNARLSDRELASKLKTSQPTITRIRTKLWNEKFVDRFLILPNLQRFGLNFHAFTFVKVSHPSLLKKIIQWTSEQNTIVFAAEGEGVSNHHYMFESLHADYGEYHSFLKQFRTAFPGQASETSSFFIDAARVSKFYHWHSVLEDRLAGWKEPLLSAEEKHRVSNRDRLRQALEKFPNPLKPREAKEKVIPPAPAPEAEKEN